MKNWSPDEIKQLRARNHLTQKSLGKLLGVTRNYVHYVEKGNIEISTTMHLLLSQIEQSYRGKGVRKLDRTIRSAVNFIKRKR